MTDEPDKNEEPAGDATENETEESEDAIMHPGGFTGHGTPE